MKNSQNLDRMKDNLFDILESLNSDIKGEALKEEVAKVHAITTVSTAILIKDMP